MHKVLWLSRHKILPKQRETLEKLFGPCEVVVDDNLFTDANDIINRINKINPDDVLVVAPLSVLHILVQKGIKPLWAEMRVVNDEFDPYSDVIEKGRHYRFIRFRRLVGIEVLYEDFEMKEKDND